MSARTKNLSPKEPERRVHAPARILVVDDRPTSRAVVKGVLSSSDYVVEEAASGAQALALVKSRPFDLIILDILMPDMDGIEVLRQIRAMDADLPVIMATVKRVNMSPLRCISARRSYARHERRGGVPTSSLDGAISTNANHHRYGRR